MIIASSGVPTPAKGPAFQKIPDTRAFFQCDPVRCVTLHKKDLVIGHVLLFVGAFYLGDGTDGSPEGLATKCMTGACWLYSIASKLQIHADRFDPPYFKEEEEKKGR